MAEDECLYDLDMLELQLQCLLTRYPSDELQKDSKRFCSDYFELVKEYTTRWSVPLPQLRIIEKALLYFTQATSSLTTSCDHLLNTLSSLALSIYELLLFFDANSFDQEPLKHFTSTFQECYAALTRHQNVHLQQVAYLIQNGGPWASKSMQAILSDSCLLQNEADKYLSSELPVFFELRVRYLLSCGRVTEALALAKRCAQHRATGKHLFFLQTYLTWLLKTSQHDRLQKEVADFTGKDAVHIICSLEFEETDETLLALSRVFLAHQLKTRDMQCLCDLVFIWSKLHNRLDTPKEAFIEESLQLMSSSTDVHSIFPFIRALTQELGEEAMQFCVEICAKALQSCLPCDVFTKSLLYKTIAGLLQNDLEVCRACALLVFFLERSVEAYKLVYVLYMHPDQEYHVDHNPIQNHIRFETLQVLKKDLYFDPEFWNLFALQTNCLELMSEKVVGDALKEVMEEKWIISYCHKLFPFGSKLLSRLNDTKKEAVENTANRIKADQSQSSQNLDHTVRRKRKRRSKKIVDETPTEPLRRSFWQLDRRHSIGPRRTTRFSDRISTKRRIRQPKWLLEDSGSLEENVVPSKFRRMRRQSMGWKKADSGQIKNNSKRKLKADADLKAAQPEEEKLKELPMDCVEPQIILEVSLPDNELPGTFSEEVLLDPRRFAPNVLFKQTLNVQVEVPAAKAAHRKEVILRARDLTMLVQLLHCYGRRRKGSSSGTNVPGSVSTITRSSVQASPTKTPPRENRSAVAKSKSHNGLDTELGSQTRASLPNRVYSVRRKKCDPGEEPAVEINVSIASPAGAMDKLPQRTVDSETSLSPNLNVSQTEVQDHKPPLSPCKEAPPNAVALQCCTSNLKAGVKEPVEHLSERSEVTHPPAQTSGPSLEQNDPKVQPSHQTGSMESISSNLNAQNNFEATTALSASGNPERPLLNEEDASDNDMEPSESTILSEESRLVFSCTSCQKVFKGSRVVEHAMFHFRKDECMFCWTTFKDDLLAMMHMSDHIEKLKKVANKTPDGCVAAAKSSAKPKTLPKSKSPSSAATGSRAGMLRSSAVHHKSSRVAGEEKSEEPLRKVEKKSFHKLNGHVSNKNSLGRRTCTMSKSKIKWLLRQRERTPASVENQADNQSADTCKRGKILSASGQQNKNESWLQENENVPVRMLRIHEFRKDTKHKVKEESLRSLEKVHCPAEGCTWNTDLTKNRVALLYHALENHRGDKRPLELSFEIANSKCSICMRVLWSFEHFQHHVERHRLTPRHPCLHQGCTARFKTGMEMRRHARMHNPLQARCCRPGCSKLFICLWALNLHEKDHYAVKSSKESRCNNTQIHDATQVCAKKNRKCEPDASVGGSSADPDSASSGVLKTESDSEHAAEQQNLSLSPKDTSPAQEKHLDASKTLKALSSFLLKHRCKMEPHLTQNSLQVSRRKQGRPRKRKEEESLLETFTDSETVEVQSGHTKSEDEETTRVDSGVRRRRGRPSKVKESSSGDGSTVGGVKEEAAEISVTGARLEDSLPGGTDVQRRGRGRPPKLRPGTNCVKDETAHTRVITDTFDSKAEEPVQSQRRGRPLKLRTGMPNNKWKAGSKTGSARDASLQNTSATTRIKNKWQRVRLNTKVRRKGRIGFNVKKVGPDGFTSLKKRNVKLGHRATDQATEDVSGKVMNLQVQEVMRQSADSSDTNCSPDAGSEKSGLTKKRSIEVVGGVASCPSQPKKPHMEDKATGSMKQQTRALPDEGLPEEGLPDEGQGASGDAPQTALGSLKEAELQMPVRKKPCLKTRSKHSKPSVKEEGGRICVDTLMEYGKKPYLRLPPTAYLDEKYTTMPRRKKEMLDQHMSQASSLQEPASAVAGQQRHRCTDCFAIFSSAPQLQEHRQLRSCSNLFGFDSDEEGSG
ncbi:uncharacterized protein ACB058_003951 [Synchiropus picturatus]